MFFDGVNISKTSKIRSVQFAITWTVTLRTIVQGFKTLYIVLHHSTALQYLYPLYLVFFNHSCYCSILATNYYQILYQKHCNEEQNSSETYNLRGHHTINCNCPHSGSGMLWASNTNYFCLCSIIMTVSINMLVLLVN